MSTLVVATLVEGGHGLVRRSGLNLHEVGSVVSALVAWHFSGVHILPGSSSAQHVVDLLELVVLSVGHFARDLVDEGTSVAGESISHGTFFDHQHIAAVGTKEQHFYKKLKKNKHTS